MTQCSECRHHKVDGDTCACASPCGYEAEEREHPGARAGWQEMAHDLFCVRGFTEDKCPLQDYPTEGSF